MALPMKIDDLVGGLTKTVQRSTLDNPDGMSYLKLNKGGFWIYGSDDVEVEEDALWAVNPHSFAVGYIAWGDASNVLGEEMVSVTDDPIIASSLPDVGAKWNQQVAMQLVCVSGEDKGEQVLYKSSSHGGRKRFNEFLQQVLVQLTSGISDNNVVPVIELASDSYKHKQYGTIYQPMFNIDSWRTMEDGIDGSPDEPAEPEPVAEPAKKPARRRRRKAA